MTKPGAAVTLYSSLDGGESTVAGTATVDEEGRFSVTVDLPDEGHYEFTATSTVGDETSGHSAPVSVTVDRQPPGQVVDLRAEVLDASHVRLTWSPPLQADPSGIAFYRWIYQLILRYWKKCRLQAYRAAILHHQVIRITKIT